MLFLFSKKKRLLLEEGTELVKKVKEVEEIISEPMDIWTDDDEWSAFRRVYTLPLEERRLFIVYSLYDSNINKVANLFNVDRKTIESRIKEIKEKIEI